MNTNTEKHPVGNVCVEDATHIVLDEESGREIYVKKEFYDYYDGDLEKYFRYHNSLGMDALNAIRERASIEELLEFANMVRSGGGGEVIDDLLMSTPQDSSECLIANALNFDCKVNSEHGGAWSMQSGDEDFNNKLADIIGHGTVSYDQDYEDEVVGAILPDKIWKVAVAFDSYADVELEKYDVLRVDNVTPV